MQKYFVPADIAILLRTNGFNEPCLFFYNLPYGDLEQVRDDDQLNSIGYQVAKNNEIHLNRYDKYTTAPLYHQVFDWLQEKGLYVRDLHVPHLNQWGGSIFSIKDGKQLWPGGNILQGWKYELYTEKEKAWNEAIIVALEILKQYEINTGSGKETQSGT